MHRAGPAALLCAVIAASAGPAGAQAPPGSGAGAGAVHGVVRDQVTDSAVAGAQVLLVGTPLAGATDQRGEFRLVGLTAGRYTLRVLAIGFAPDSVADLSVAAGATVEVAVSLQRVVLQLPGIDVTASGSARSLSEAPVSVSVMDLADLFKYSPVQLPDVLPYMPGVVMNHGQLDIRGSTGSAGGLGSRVLMLLDGHPVLTGDGGEIDFEDLPMMDLERAEVVKGSQSALYGSGAMGGVVNLITSAIDERPTTDVRLHYGAYDPPKDYRFDSRRLDYSGIDLQHSRAIGPVGVRFALGRETSDGYQQNGNFSRWLLRTKLSSMPGSAHPWDAYAVWSSITSGQFSTWLSATQPYLVDTVNSAPGDWNHVNNLLLGGKYVALAGSGALLEIEPSVTHTEVRDHMKESHNWHRATRAGTTVQLAFNPGSAHAVTAGVDVAASTVNSSYYGGKTIEDAAPYAQEEFTLTPALSLTGGVRLDYHHADGGRAETALNPKLAAAVTPAGPFSFRASIGRGYRAPSAIEQFLSTTQQGVHVIPNPLLHGETSWSGELGATASLGRLWLDGTLFNSWYHDLIGPAFAPGAGFAVSFQNVQRAWVRGVDATTKVAVTSGLDLDVNYLFLDTRNSTTGLPLPYRSRHQVTGSLDLLGGAAGVDVRYRSRPDQVLEYPADPRSDITVVDLRCGIRLARTTMQVKVSNLLQAKYVDIQERNQGAPRSLLVTATANL